MIITHKPIHWAKILSLCVSLSMVVYFTQDRFDKKDVDENTLRSFVVHDLAFGYPIQPLTQALTASIALVNGNQAVAIANYLALAQSTHDFTAIKEGLRLSIANQDYPNARQFASLWAQTQPQSKEAKLLVSILAMPEPQEGLSIFGQQLGRVE